jgi:uncharacterized protein YndB with AHSA1/START domain
MTVISSTKDAAALTLVVVADFDAEPERVWQVWEDPRQLERWWGPPTYPATFTRHDFVVGGQSRYHMTGPGGETSHGWWRIDAIDRPHGFDFANGLAGDNGEPVPGVEPMAGTITLEATGTGTRMTTVTRFVDAEQMEKMLGMGMQEGMTAAMSQIDGILAGAAV